MGLRVVLFLVINIFRIAPNFGEMELFSYLFVLYISITSIIILMIDNKIERFQ